jgi:hypothetical protein
MDWGVSLGRDVKYQNRSIGSVRNPIERISLSDDPPPVPYS